MVLLGPVDAKGRLYSGDELIYLLAQDRVRRCQPVPGVVGTLMTNMAVELAVRAQGMGFVRAKVGDRYVLEALAENGWTIGGEGSGHILALDNHSTGDGVIAALQVLQAVVRSGQSLAQLLGGLTLFPLTMINVRVQPGTDWKQNQALQDGIASAEARLQGRGRVLIRDSGTEPLLRVMMEADDAALAEGLAKELAALV